jgi:cyanophycinase
VAGALGLLGGDELHAACEAFDRALLAAAGEPEEVRVVPTAVVQNGSVSGAMSLARAYFGRRLGRRVVEVKLHRRSDASRNDVVETLRTSPMTYLLGGDPGYLLDALLGTPAWAALRAAHREGGGLAGSSAGAMVLCESILLRSRNPSPSRRHARDALALLPGVVLIPHLARFGSGWLEAARREANGRDIVGLDESTGLVHGGTWTAHGPGEVKLWRHGQEPPVLRRDGESLRWRAPRP